MPSDDEVKSNLQSMFDAMDTNKDGSLDFHELQTGLRKAGVDINDVCHDFCDSLLEPLYLLFIYYKTYHYHFHCLMTASSTASSHHRYIKPLLINTHYINSFHTLYQAIATVSYYV